MKKAHTKQQNARRLSGLFRMWLVETKLLKPPSAVDWCLRTTTSKAKRKWGNLRWKRWKSTFITKENVCLQKYNVERSWETTRCCKYRKLSLNFHTVPQQVDMKTSPSKHIFLLSRQASKVCATQSALSIDLRQR